MCGLGGYSGITDQSVRVKLAGALGVGLDKRGGHAAGYVSLPVAGSGKGVGMARRAGTWGDSSWRFVKASAAGEVAILHARFATCGEKDNALHAHPFAIRRGDRAVLYGAHNGIVYGGRDTAKEAGRDYTVDSKELFELLADGKLDAIRKLSGYGVINWITPATGVVHMARLSSQSDFACVKLKGGGIAWASTMAILDAAVKFSGDEAEDVLLAPTVGMVYTLSPDGIRETSEDNLRVGSNTSTGRPTGWGGYPYGLLGEDGFYEDYRSSHNHVSNRARNEGPMFRVGDQFKGSDGIAWTKLADGWIKDEDMKPLSSSRNRVRVSSAALLTQSSQSGLSTRARSGECIHGAKLAEPCESCTGPKTKKPDAVTTEDKVPDTERSSRFFPDIQVVDGDVEWEPIEVGSGRVVWIPTDLDAMTDEQLGELTETQWETIMAQYTPEEEETPDSAT